MKTTMQKFSYLFLSVLIVLISSCEGDVGPAGTDGTDGVAGTDGAAGTDGVDGNANVQTFLFTAPAWTPNTNKMELIISEITQEVLENDVVLGFLEFEDLWYSSNALLQFGGSLKSNVSTGKYFIYAYDDNNDPITDNSLIVTSAKVLIIESNNTTTTTGNGGRSSVNSKQAIFNELENAGVDVNSYEQVAAYYNITD